MLVVFRCQQYLLLNSHCLSLSFKFTAGRHQFVFKGCSYDSDLFDSLKQTILTSHDPKQYFGWFSSPKKVFLDSWMSHLTVYLTRPNKLLDTSWPWALSFLTSLVPKQHFWWFSSPKKNLPGVKNESFQRSFKSHVQEFSKRY